MVAPEPAPAGAGKKALGGTAAAVALILSAVFAVEGGYVNDPSDPGGATNHGVTEKVARASGYKGSMRDFQKHCSEAHAVCADLIYTRDYIIAPGFMPIVGLDPAVAEELVDSAVNFGPARPSRWFQQSLNQLHNGRQTVKVDGKVGHGTVASFRALRAALGASPACRALLNLLDGRQANEYRRLAKADPRFNRFLKGWLRNRVGNVDRKACEKGAAL